MYDKRQSRDFNFVCEEECEIVQRFQAITVTHKQFKINELGNLLPESKSPSHDLHAHLGLLKEHFGWDEVLFLNTCNRILFFVYTERDLHEDSAKEVYQHFHAGLDPDTVTRFASGSRILKGQEAMQHLFEVASSVDSMVVGEREILHQLKKAHEQCKEAGLCGDNIRVAVDHAIGAAKAVYRETRIGVNPVSVVALSIKQILSHHPSKESRFLLIGAGQTMSLVGKYLKKHDFKHFTIYNRTVANAGSLSKSLNASVHALSELAHHDGPFDIIISCTGSTSAIVDSGIYEKISDGKEKIMVDLAVPADISRDTSSREEVTYIGIDDLEKLAEQNKALRLKEVEAAKKIISRKGDVFSKAVRKRRVERAMHSIPENIRAIKSRALNEVFNSELQALDSEAKATLEKVIDYLEKKYIGIPMGIAQKALDEELDAEN